jgi:hypothetical protein
MTKRRITRVAIVCDEDCNWYVRRVREIRHDLDRDEMIYYCDQPIGGRFDTLDAACDAAMAVQEPRRKCGGHRRRVSEVHLPLDHLHWYLGCESGKRVTTHATLAIWRGLIGTNGMRSDA